MILKLLPKPHIIEKPTKACQFHSQGQSSLSELYGKAESIGYYWSTVVETVLELYIFFKKLYSQIKSNPPKFLPVHYVNKNKNTSNSLCFSSFC